MQFLKKNLYLFMLSAFVAVAACSFTTKSFDGSDKDKVLVDLVTHVLERMHFEPKAIDDAFSEAVFDQFINDIDPLKRYFLASDIAEFKKYEHRIDDQIKGRELTFFNLVHERLEQRRGEAEKIYKIVLEAPFDYSDSDVVDLDYENLPYADNPEALKERWRLQLKYSAIGNYYDLQEEQRLRKEKPEDYEDVPLKTAAEMEAEARESTRSSMDDYFDFIGDLNRNDYFAIFVNTLVENFDPHTNYMAPSDKERFDVSMSGKLEGIGARLQKERDNVKIVELISGGPAWRSEELEVGDQIQKVRQEDETEAVSIVGMRLDDAVQLIKGPKGSKVTLTVKKVDGSIEDITLIRDVVELEETYAKSSLIRQGDHTYGLIHLPRFYFDMDDYKARNSASDVRDLVLKLKDEGVEGLVLDLRNNGGGSLRTAIDIAGLFIESGPVVQVADGNGKTEVLRDRSRNVVWDGPLVIMVNEVSASASEILAAAVQDYGRGIVVGSKQTYGKGTVQNVADLNRWLRNNSLGDMGALKVTTQKFYRINGGSTQLEGVRSDIVIPDRYSYIDIGERDYKNPMPYDKIAPANYSIWKGAPQLQAAIANSRERVRHSEYFELMDQNARWIKERRDNNRVSLNYQQYLAEIENNKAKAETFDALSDYETDLDIRSLPYEVALKEADTTLAQKRDRWHKNLRRDAYVEEAIHVLTDLNNPTTKPGKVAVKE